MRLFAAVKIPEKIREGLWENFSSRIPAGAFKRVEKENLHITISFIGEADEAKALEIAAKMREINFAEFGVKISGAGSFGNRVLWLAISEGKKGLERLASEFAEKTGISGEKFHAHITIARNRGGGGEFSAVAEKLGKVKREFEFTAKSVSLFSSTLTSKGPAYEEVSERTFSSSDSGS
ncbi:MAG TPA: RNA 2',3'-cyclic phosphodiesterase [archaeon]|nr:RNA 2',3'-cyclic phosphodiesterase [archaeon]